MKVQSFGIVLVALTVAVTFVLPADAQVKAYSPGDKASPSESVTQAQRAKRKATVTTPKSAGVDSSNAVIRSDAEMSMIELQSLVAKRGTALQLTTGMMNSLNEGQKSVAKNIGGGSSGPPPPSCKTCVQDHVRK
jgi:uncharacterized ferredoxin-like protein